MRDAWAAEAYCEYAAQLNWRDPAGDPLPTWDGLSARQRWAWMAAVETVWDRLQREFPILLPLCLN